MPINTEEIRNIVIKTTDRPVDFSHFENFIHKSPFVRQIAFIGRAIFDMPNFPEMVKMCAVNNITLLFGEMGETSVENAYALVENQNVLFVNIHENDANIEKINYLKNKLNVQLPDVNIIVPAPPHYPQDDISEDSYAFYNLADDTRNIACLNLIKEPMINYDGALLGCWQNPDKKHPINAFDLGIDAAINHPEYRKILKMLKSGKINISAPCARCPIFASLIWSDKTIDVCERFKH